MRIARLDLVALIVVATAACNSSRTTSLSGGVHGPRISAQGQWIATDSLGDTLALDLTQAADSITGIGHIGAAAVAVAGVNLTPYVCSCNCPCRAPLDVNLMVGDQSGDSLRMFGLFQGDTNQLVAAIVLRSAAAFGTSFAFASPPQLTLVREHH